MGLTRYYKTTVFFTFIFAVFLLQSTAVIPIFRFWKQMAAMWNYTSSFDFGPAVAIGMWFGIGLQILSELDDKWRSCDVMSITRSRRWRQRRRKSTSGFSFGDVSHLITSKSIRIPNLAKIAQYAAEILLFPVSENKRPPYWNSTSGSTLTFPSSSA